MIQNSDAKWTYQSSQFPPPMFIRTATVSWFHLSLPPLCENTLRGLYTKHVRSSSAIWNEDGRHQRLDSQTGLGSVWPGVGLAPLGLVWSVVAPSHASSSQVYCQVKIGTPEKGTVNLSSKRSLKCQNTQNRYFLFCRVITKIRRIDGKSP
jgi:hypothetical protein